MKPSIKNSIALLLNFKSDQSLLTSRYDTPAIKEKIMVKTGKKFLISPVMLKTREPINDTTFLSAINSNLPDVVPKIGYSIV